MRVVDLTQPMTNGMPVMDGITPPRFHDLARVEADGYAMSEYAFINHTGTHVDAPAHQVAGGATLDEIPLDRLVTEALTIDVTGRKPGPVGLDELAPRLPEVRAGDIVLREAAIEAEEVGEALWEGLADGRFLILPHPAVGDYYRMRAEDTDRWLRGMNRVQQRIEEAGL